MATWTREFGSLLDFVLFAPSSTVELVILALLAAGAFVWTLTKVGRLVGTPLPDAARSTIVLIVSVLLLSGSYIAAKLYGAPRISNAGLASALPILGSVLGLIVLAAPAVCLIQRAKYMKAVGALALSVAAAAVVIALAQGAFNAVRHGGDSLPSGRQRTRELDGIQ